MTVFNSLGSNYSWGFALKNLLAIGNSSHRKQLEKMFGQYYGGSATTTYKGREALEMALRRSGLPTGSAVGINGFTCYVLYKAVQNAGYQPIPLDVTTGSLHFGLTELQQAYTANQNLGAIIIQNTLGYPVDMLALEGYCQQNSILLIEDLAHSIGTFYSDNREAGTVGKFTMLSFSQDKPVDVVAGGILVDRRQPNEAAVEKLPYVSSVQRLKNRTYPILTSLIRLLYPIGLGRILHYLLKRLKLMATPMSDNLKGLHTMSPSTAKILLDRWEQRAIDLEHRRQIAGIYTEQLPKEMQFEPLYGKSSYLRFPVQINDRTSLLQYMKESHIYIGDTWYDAPYAPKKYMARTDYRPGTCPLAEGLAEQVVNLPTHRYINPVVARHICATIKQWQALSQSKK